MHFTLLYLIERAAYRVIEFLRHWYVKSVRIYWNFVLNRLEELDRFFAWKITFRHLFQPLYKDYSFFGYVLGFIFRFLRLLIASVAYAFIFLIAFIIYITWLLIPPYIVYRIFFYY
ncbi:MAG: hypothetical protein UW92_C0016G0011 [Candidatus Jorgensenbacteria bacterium GW2011_GWA2_45_13]|uniref:Uncharacterized protein n=1 Tax=Candidatus Jorgensenbacteria bacterium GW2011_GWA2_45_13 TaxID=1618662 RepID=A0A0G1NDL3_9BACT|nr:MAG: hypothetical protein UW92_C0016G0011 [Candidatus Jorgensenbacteria bacterium GW2011_GWA2_45_13]